MNIAKVITLVALSFSILQSSCGGDPAVGGAGPTGCSITVKGTVAGSTGDISINETTACNTQSTASSTTFNAETNHGVFIATAGVGLPDRKLDLSGAVLYFIGPPTNITETSSNLLLDEENPSTKKVSAITCYGGFGSSKGIDSRADFTANPFQLTFTTLEPTIVGTGMTYLAHGTLHSKCGANGQPSDRITMDIVF